jgi:NAD(P) transhydrogenase subunit alpha
VKIGVLKESRQGETRVSITPLVVQNLRKMGFEVNVETGAGLGAHYSDAVYSEAGAQVLSRADVYASDVMVQVNIPDAHTIGELPQGKIWISSIYHRNNADLVSALNEKQTTVLSLDAVPRISRAQSMDILSSQANLAGYRAVIEGAYHLDRIFPLLMTAAGTVTPSKVLIFGVGVAGLQAIATAKRLGAVVEATDVRPETKEQVESLGGKFIEVKGVEVGSEGGYAKEASEEYRKAQREAVNLSLAKSDLVITTALVPGRKAPVLIDDEQLALMKNGSVIIDMAAEQGGNCSQSIAGEINIVNGVKIVGSVNMPAAVSGNASDLFARNIWELLKLIGPKGTIALDEADEIVAGCLIAHQGKILKTDA